MRKIISIVVMVLVVFGVVGNMAANAKDIKIGVSMPTLQEERWKKDEAIIKKRLMSHGVKPENILIQSANGDEQKQVTQSENLITQGIDALIIIPQNGEACAPIIKSAHEAGVEVISVDRNIASKDLDFFVTFDAFQEGRVQGEYIASLQDSGNWIMVGGAPTDPNAALIRNGQMSVVQPLIDAGKVKIIIDQPAEYWNPANALRIVEAGLTKANNDIQVVFTSNDGCGGAAIEALEEQGLAGKVPVPGLDCDLAACQRIVKGTQSMSVYRKLSIMDENAADIAYAFATGADPIEMLKKQGAKLGYKDGVPAVILDTPDVIFAVDANNMKSVVDDGWLNADDIYSSLDESLWPEWYKSMKK